MGHVLIWIESLAVSLLLIAPLLPAQVGYAPLAFYLNIITCMHFCFSTILFP